MKKIMAEVSWVENGLFRSSSYTRVRECAVLEEREKIVKVRFYADEADMLAVFPRADILTQWIKKEKILEVIE